MCNGSELTSMSTVEQQLKMYGGESKDRHVDQSQNNESEYYVLHFICAVNSLTKSVASAFAIQELTSPYLLFATPFYLCPIIHILSHLAREACNELS